MAALHSHHGSLASDRAISHTAAGTTFSTDIKADSKVFIEEKLQSTRMETAPRAAKRKIEDLFRDDVVSPADRADITYAVYVILRDNLPPSFDMSDDELVKIAMSIEKKLYRASSSTQAYRALSTLESRLTAMATAILIHTDGVDERHQVSDTCKRLMAAARKSLVYCVMVLVSYATKNSYAIHNLQKE